MSTDENTSPEPEDNGSDPWAGMVDEDGVPFDHTQAGIETARLQTERREEISAETPDIFKAGGDFILDQPDLPPAVWGDGDHVIWAEGEACLIAAPQGVGKTTLALQVVKARLGLTTKVLGYSVAPTRKNVLYLAMDRPSQWRRAAARLFTDEDRAVLNDRLKVWAAPPPYDMAQRRDILAVMAKKANADTVIVDSLKDAALGLSTDEVGAGYNRARQQALSEGVQVLELHHTRKAGNGEGSSEPSTIDGVYGSTWITSGAGSVISLWGSPGDPVVRWRHLKQPAQEVGPFTVVHDHDAGTSEVEAQVDVLRVVASAGASGLTAEALARRLFDAQKITPALREKARRQLDKRVNSGHLIKRESTQSGVPAAYFLAASARQELF